MCGITGFIATAPTGINRYLHGHRRLTHRGPDDEGFVAGTPSGTVLYRGARTIAAFHDQPHISETQTTSWILGHHRLSIVDLSPGGHQPMVLGNRYWIVFNGEIYNHIELRQQLEAMGRNFQSRSDTEVILQAFDQWGSGCFAHFNGMWALAIFDTQEQRLWLSRDRAGVKPLYWSIVGHALYFASELKFMRSVLDSPQLDEALAADFLATSRSEHHERSLVHGVFALRPGHVLTTRTAELTPRIQAYWQLPDPTEMADFSYAEAVEELQHLLDSSIDLRMRSDVPVGSLLSGGLDSTAIVTNLASRGRLKAESFHSYSAVYPEEKYSERRFIEHTVRRNPQIVPHFIIPDAATITHDLPDLIEAIDGPMRSLAVYAQYCLYRSIARDGIVKVLLNGQGADELFAGYTSYRTAWAAEALPNLALALRRLGNAGPRGIGQSLRRLRWMLSLRLGNDSTGLDSSIKIAHIATDPAPERSASPLRRQLRRSLTFSALPEYLRYEDRNSMHFSLESRLPFLDYRLIEFAARLPSDWLLTTSDSKHILRDAVAPYVTTEVAQRRDKQGFVTPQYEWQNGPLRDFMLTNLRDCDFACIRPSDWKLWRHNYETQYAEPFFAWRAVSLHLWMQQWGF